MGESRTELLQWLNDLLQLNYTKVEQCGTGAAYCQILDSIYGKHPHQYIFSPTLPLSLPLKGAPTPAANSHSYSPYVLLQLQTIHRCAFLYFDALFNLSEPFPLVGDVPLSRVKFTAKHEYEFLANFKVLQNVFKQHKVDKVRILRP